MKRLMSLLFAVVVCLAFASESYAQCGVARSGGCNVGSSGGCNVGSSGGCNVGSSRGCNVSQSVPRQVAVPAPAPSAELNNLLQRAAGTDEQAAVRRKPAARIQFDPDSAYAFSRPIPAPAASPFEAATETRVASSNFMLAAFAKR